MMALVLFFNIFSDKDPHLNPIQDGLFRGCSRIGGGGGLFGPPLLKIRHTYPWHSYTLPKEDPKNA